MRTWKLKMLEESIVEHCAPTLAGIKAGSLFSYRWRDRAGMYRSIGEFNRRYVPRGVCLLPLKIIEGYALLYLFRPHRLMNSLNNSIAISILSREGYDYSNENKCIMKLISRIKSGKDFPHEIGLFLSYPPEDVEGFIENHAKRCKCSGYWKVYGDEAKAKREFERIKLCRQIYKKHWESGFGLDRLAIAV